MNQCQTCFALYNGTVCAHCGARPVNRSAPVILAPEALRPADDADDGDEESIAFSVLSWGRRGLLLALIFLCSMVALEYVSHRNQAAQASWLAQSQLGGQVDARRAELQAAVEALQTLYTELIKTYSVGGMSDGERINWALRWRDQLGEVPVAYRLNINTNIGLAGGNARAEQSLRNAMLYLTSLERAMAAGQGTDTAASLEVSFRQSLDQARKELN